MSALIEIALKAGPWLLAFLGLLFGWARHKQAQTTQAQARQAKAEADARAAQVDAIQAKANEDAARVGANNAKVRRDEDSDAGVLPDGAAQKELKSEWTR